MIFIRRTFNLPLVFLILFFITSTLSIPYHDKVNKHMVREPYTENTKQSRGWDYASLLAYIMELRRRSCLSHPPLVAVLTPLNKSGVTGQVYFENTFNKAKKKCIVHVKAKVKGLNKKKEHGFHIHEYGDMRSDDGKLTGGHYNPYNVTHGLPKILKRHIGDMGNLFGNANGFGNYSSMNPLLVLENIVGRSVIVHAKLDDGSQPTGNAGSRLAQGCIGYAMMKKE